MLANSFGSSFEHVVVSLDGRRDALARLEPGVSVTVAEERRLSRYGLATGLPRLWSSLRRVRHDALLTYNWGSIEWALAHRLRPACPHLHFEDGFGVEESRSQLARRVWLRRLALSGRTRVVVPSETLHEIALQRWRLCADRVVLIPNGVDRAQLELEAAAPLAVRASPDEVVIGTLGGLRAEKNQARLLRIAGRLPRTARWRVAIAGDGPLRQVLEREAARAGLGDRVSFVGTVEQPGAFLAGIDVFVLTSDTEQMPLSVLEAMALGLPVLATAVGDLGRMLPDGSACLFTPEDEAGFAARLAGLIGGPAARARFGAANRARSETFTAERMVARHQALLEEVLRRHSHA